MILALTHIAKSYGSIKALHDVRFDLYAGEIHAICGENGAGKSTLMHILSGDVSPDAGQIMLRGQLIKLENQQQAIQYGIAIVHQHLSLFENLSVAENIFVHHFPKNKWNLIDYKGLAQKTKQLLQELKIDPTIQPETILSRLSPGQKQMVEIAKAMAKNPSILILDEPTASISESDSKNLFKLLIDFKLKGTAIIYISHRMEEIFQVADRITVLKDGKYIATHPAADMSRAQLIHLMVGRSLNISHKAHSTQPEVLFEAVQLQNDDIKDISFTLYKGEILAMAGLVGAGRTEIGKTIYGALKKDSGRLFLHKKQITIDHPSDALRHKIVYLPEDRKALGLFPEMSVAENISSTNFTESAALFYNYKNSTTIAQKYSDTLNIKAPSIHTPVNILSGGNQQKVVFAKWLATEPDVMIIDEPTAGIDIGAKFEIYELLRQLAAKGKSILLISSDLQEILTISDRILVINKGRITKTLSTAQTSEAEIVKYAV